VSQSRAAGEGELRTGWQGAQSLQSTPQEVPVGPVGHDLGCLSCLHLLGPAWPCTWSVPLPALPGTMSWMGPPSPPDTISLPLSPSGPHTHNAVWPTFTLGHLRHEVSLLSAPTSLLSTVTTTRKVSSFISLLLHCVPGAHQALALRGVPILMLAELLC
jgi:hypothetical protein